MSPLMIIALGFLLGIRHATDPDHVVAVSAMVSRERSVKRAAWLGLSWGIGHSVTVVAAGSGMILFGLTLPPRLGLGLELAVAVMLIVVGSLNVAAFRRGRTHTRARELDVASTSTPSPPSSKTPTRTFLRSLLIGVVHGLAGSAAIAIVVVASIPDRTWALLYLLLFGLGTMGGMVAITVALALPFVVTRTAARLQTKVVWLTGVASILVGVGVAYQVIIVGGWLSTAPTWTPH